jgi:hypothetical protein
MSTSQRTELNVNPEEEGEEEEEEGEEECVDEKGNTKRRQNTK